MPAAHRARGPYGPDLPVLEVLEELLLVNRQSRQQPETLLNRVTILHASGREKTLFDRDPRLVELQRLCTNLGDFA